jgi:hypothetical protein
MQTRKQPPIYSLLESEIHLLLFDTGAGILNETYERPFRGLLSSIEPIYPQTASLLESLEVQFGSLAAFRATEVVRCLQARVETWGIEAAGVLTEDDVATFPYFEIMQDSLPALELLIDVLECYAEECQLLYTQGMR